VGIHIQSSIAQKLRRDKTPLRPSRIC
jgi:hypothetical protein